MTYGFPCCWRVFFGREWLLVAGVWLLGALGLASAEAASPQPWLQCSRLQRDSYFRPAADCYAKVAATLKVGPQTPEALRVRKGYLLREAAKNLDKAANTTDRKEVASHLRERAVRLLREVLANKWVPRVRGKRRGRYTRSLLATIQDKIVYTPLGISTGNPKATIRVTGYKFSKTTQGSLNQKLHPGRYQVTVSFPGQKPKSRRIVLKAKRAMVLTFVEKPGPPPLAWVGYTVGSAALVGGGILMAVGIAQGLAANNCTNDPNCSFIDGAICYDCLNQGRAPDNQSTFQAYQNRALLFGLLGGAGVATGVALLSAGGVAHARAVSSNVTQREKTVAAPPAPRSSSFGFVLIQVP